MLNNKYYVYALIDPINNLPFYIGKGCGNRAWQHLKLNEQCNKKKLRYISNIRSLGFEPIVKFVQENMNEKDAYSLEHACIKYGKKFLPITNIVGIRQPPCRKGAKVSESSRAKMALSQSKRIRLPMSDEQKLKLSLVNKNKRLSDETKKKISTTLKEKSFNIEKSVLLELRKNYTTGEIAKMYNLSISPIKRLVKLYGIQTK